MMKGGGSRKSRRNARTQRKQRAGRLEVFKNLERKGEEESIRKSMENVQRQLRLSRIPHIPAYQRMLNAQAAEYINSKRLPVFKNLTRNR